MASPALNARLHHDLDPAFDIVRSAVAQGALPSAVLAVADAHEVLRVEAAGSVTIDAMFLIASITKPIFSCAIMHLVEQGRLLLNERVTRVVPEFAANDKGDVRLWHLLTHTSGLDESWISLNGGIPGRAEWQSIVELACRAPLRFRPGTQYAYCNLSFCVMAEMVRRVSGREHAAVLDELVLQPLGMSDTSFTPPDSPRVAEVHDAPWSDHTQRCRWIGLRSPGAGLWSTAADLVRFGQMLLREGAPILSRAGVTTMTSHQTLGISNRTASGDYASYYGLGFSLSGPNAERGPSAELRSRQGFGHGGATGTYLWVEPALELVFVFLTNRWGIDDDSFRRALNATIAARSRRIGGEQ